MRTKHEAMQTSKLQETGKGNALVCVCMWKWEGPCPTDSGVWVPSASHDYTYLAGLRLLLCWSLLSAVLVSCIGRWSSLLLWLAVGALVWRSLRSRTCGVGVAVAVAAAAAGGDSMGAC
jgi:hypothetical protein